MTFQAFTDLVRQHLPQWAVVLGSGLGSVPEGLQELARLEFAAIPGMTSTSVHGHAGQLVLGLYENRPVLIFRGRLHQYEGHPRERIALLPCLCRDLQIRNLLLTNAAGGIADCLNPGDLMLLDGHRFLQDADGWKREAEFPYSSELQQRILTQEQKRGRTIHRGIYAALTGPCYETPSEIHALRSMGCDAVGMSTAFEARVARDLGLQVVAISCITNKAAGLAPGKLDHSEVMREARKPAMRLSEILADLLRH